MSELFLIAGGGSGAKVAEALVHLCAVGMGPERMHVLLVDTDTNNGNLKRTTDTIDVFKKLRQWPWTVSPSGDGNAKHILFASDIQYYKLTDPVETVKNGGLDGATVGDPEQARVMRLLYDEAERQDRCADGFRARPNLGTLLLGHHLRKKMESARAGVDVAPIGSFVTALVGAAAQPGTVPVLVVGSVFGGTGASLLPIARISVEHELAERKLETLVPRLRWGLIMLLPYFLPTDRICLPDRRDPLIDPDRFLLDASSALQFYGLLNSRRASVPVTGGAPANQPEVTYLIGSDRPEAYQAKACIGSKDQVNPAFVEEVIAGLAALDFMGDNQDPLDANTVRILRRQIHKEARLLARDLPQSERFSQAMGCLLNLAAFFLRAKGSDPGECRQGLWRYLSDFAKRNDREEDGRSEARRLKEMARAGWFDTLINDWINGVIHEDNKAGEILRNIEASAMRAKRLEVLVKSVVPDSDKGMYLMRTLLRDVAEYFGRLILWSGTSLQAEEVGVVRFDTEARELGQCVYLHNALCRVSPAQIQQDENDARRYSPTRDNALLRLVRGALVGLLAQKSVHHKYDIRLFSVEKGQPLLVRLPTEELSAGLAQIFDQGEVKYYLRSYGWNEKGPDAGQTRSNASKASTNRFLPRPADLDYALTHQADKENDRGFSHEAPRLIREVGELMEFKPVSSEGRIPSPFSRAYMFYLHLFGAALASSTPVVVGPGDGAANSATRNPEFFRERAQRAFRGICAAFALRKSLGLNILAISLDPGLRDPNRDTNDIGSVLAACKETAPGGTAFRTTIRYYAVADRDSSEGEAVAGFSPLTGFCPSASRL